MVWSPSVKLIVAVHEAVPEALLQLSPSVLTSTNASPTLSDAFPVTTVGPAGRVAPATGERIWIVGLVVSVPTPDAFGAAGPGALRAPSPIESVPAPSHNSAPPFVRPPSTGSRPPAGGRTTRR